MDKVEQVRPNQYKPELAGVVAAETGLSRVDGQAGEPHKTFTDQY